MDSIDIVDTPACQFCDGSTCEGGVGQKSLDSGNRHQFDRLGTRRGHAGLDREVSLSRHFKHLRGREFAQKRIIPAELVGLQIQSFSRKFRMQFSHCLFMHTVFPLFVFVLQAGG